MGDLAPEILTFTIADATEIFEELKHIQVQLDADPLAYGPKRLNGKVAECRKALHRVERLFIRVSQKLHSVSRGHRRAELDIELAKKQLLAEDPHVRAGRSVADRDAEASMKLLEEIKALDELDLTRISLEQTMAVVKAKRADLKSTVSMLKDQMRLCQEEIGLGAQWGSKKIKAPDFKPVDATADLGDLEDMLGVLEGEIPLPELCSPPEEEPEEILDESSEDPAEESGAVPEMEKAPSAEVVLPDMVPADLVESFLDVPKNGAVGSSAQVSASGKISDALLDVDSILDSFEEID